MDPPPRFFERGQRDEVTLNHLFEVMLKNMPHETNMQNSGRPIHPNKALADGRFLWLGPRSSAEVVTLTGWLGNSESA